MGTIELKGNPPIDVSLRRSARAKRMSLRISGLDGKVTLTLPRFVAEAEGRAFLRDKESWLRGHLEGQAAPVPVGFGSELPVEGDLLRIVPGAGRAVKRVGDLLEVPGAEAQVARRVETWVKARARTRLGAAVDLYAARLGRTPSRITLRDTRSRWGSCAATGALSFSWRLILAPPEILDYVAAHEVAHLKEMNHSQRFWDVVTEIHGPWQEARRWLRREGPGLHRFVFA